MHELIPKPGYAAYSVAKGGLGNLTRTLALEFASRGIRVNAVAPAVVKTDFAKALYEGREDKASRGYAMKRLGEPEDIAGAIAGLRSVGADAMADVMDAVSLPHAEARYRLMADVKGQRLGEVLVEAKGAGQRPGDLRYFE